jgi:hypothetical protein
MKRTITVLAIGVALTTSALIASSELEQQPPKPVKEVYNNTYWKGPARTLGETILAVNAVVRGRVVGSTPRDTQNDVATAYRIKVEEIIHEGGGRPMSEPEISVLRRIGDRDRGAYV